MKEIDIYGTIEVMKLYKPAGSDKGNFKEHVTLFIYPSWKDGLLDLQWYSFDQVSVIYIMLELSFSFVVSLRSDLRISTAEKYEVMI